VRLWLAYNSRLARVQDLVALVAFGRDEESYRAQLESVANRLGKLLGHELELDLARMVSFYDESSVSQPMDGAALAREAAATVPEKLLREAQELHRLLTARSVVGQVASSSGSRLSRPR
jgi:hypothetical protein